MNIQVIIECVAGSDIKNVFDEVSLVDKESFQVSRAYPFPYGFIQNTRSGDGDCLDCFILTRKPLKVKDKVDVEVVGFFEQFETRDGVTKADHNVLAVLKSEDFFLTDKIKNTLKDFVEHVWDHRKGKEVKTGNFYGKKEAEAFITSSKI